MVQQQPENQIKVTSHTTPTKIYFGEAVLCPKDPTLMAWIDQTTLDPTKDRDRRPQPNWGGLDQPFSVLPKTIMYYKNPSKQRQVGQGFYVKAARNLVLSPM